MYLYLILILKKFYLNLNLKCTLNLNLYMYIFLFLDFVLISVHGAWCMERSRIIAQRNAECKNSRTRTPIFYFHFHQFV